LKETVTLQINGESYELFIEPKKTLLEVLREISDSLEPRRFVILETVEPCTVLLDNRPVLSCLTLAVSCGGKEITTIEGLKKGERLHPLQLPLSSMVRFSVDVYSRDNPFSQGPFG